MAKVLHNQSLLDFAVQHTGDVMNAFSIAMENGLAMSDKLEIGTVLKIPNSISKDRDTLDYYLAKKIKPATAITNLFADGTPEPQLEGIGYWFIGDDNIVS